MILKIVKGGSGQTQMKIGGLANLRCSKNYAKGGGVIIN